MGRKAGSSTKELPLKWKMRLSPRQGCGRVPGSGCEALVWGQPEAPGGQAGGWREGTSAGPEPVGDQGAMNEGEQPNARGERVLEDLSPDKFNPIKTKTSSTEGSGRGSYG